VGVYTRKILKVRSPPASAAADKIRDAQMTSSTGTNAAAAPTSVRIDPFQVMVNSTSLSASHYDLLALNVEHAVRHRQRVDDVGRSDHSAGELFIEPQGARFVKRHYDMLHAATLFTHPRSRLGGAEPAGPDHDSAVMRSAKSDGSGSLQRPPSLGYSSCLPPFQLRRNMLR